jgi:hypothetical protein
VSDRASEDSWPVGERGGGVALKLFVPAIPHNCTC